MAKSGGSYDVIIAGAGGGAAALALALSRYPLRVLLVDSDRDTQLVVSALLKTAGYEVLLASSAEAAFDVLRVSPVDLVMLEWSLPPLRYPPPLWPEPFCPSILSC